MPLALMILGFGLVFVGVWFAVGGLGGAAAQGQALKGISVQGPSWLILVALGVGTIIFGAWQFEEKGITGSTSATTIPSTTTTTPPTTIPLEPFTYGDDPDLDDLWDACFDGDWADCDELYLIAPLGSDYEWFGGTCGGLIDEDGLFCEEVPVEELEQALEVGKPAMTMTEPPSTSD